MAMRGIDISDWQRGIDISAIPDLDFVICKATQGDWYTSESFDAQMNGAANAGKLLGVYHYIDGTGGVEAEMQRFYNVIKPWIGKAIICLDWEPGGNGAWGNTGYLKQCIQSIANKTGKTIVVYCSAGLYPWDEVLSTDSVIWMAQYANTNPTGWQDTPWNEGAYACAIRQYSGTGRLPGYDGYLDLNKAYIDANAWRAIAGADTTSGTIATGGKKRRKKMECIFQPNEESYLVYYDGGKTHPLSHPDEVTAINMVYKQCYGTDIPMFALGTKNAPWATRFMQAVARV